MSEFQRQHPVAAVSRAFGLIRGNFVTILVFLFVGAQSESFPFLWWIGGGFGFLLIMGAANWWRFLYKIEDGVLHIKSGIFVRKDLYLTRDRVQVIDITSGMIQRLFGLVKLDIQTAGASSRQAAIDAITMEKAVEINRLLRNEEGGNEGPQPVSNADNAETDGIRTSIKLPPKELLIAASTSGSFGIALSVIATVFSQIEPLLSESELFEYLFEMLPAQTDAVMVTAIIAVFVVVAWLLSFFGTLFSYGNFQLDIKEKEMIVSRGIFEKKRITVPYNRIQAIHVTEGIIRQPLGYASLHLESAGYGDEKGSGSFVLYPLIRRNRILPLLDDVLPDYRKELTGITPPVRALRRYLIRHGIPVLAVTAVLHLFLDLTLLIWLLPLLAVCWGGLKYRDAALGWDDDTLILRSRSFSRSTAYIKKNRIQDITFIQSPFQRRSDLCTLQVFVASGDRGKSFTVRDIEEKDGLRVLSMIRHSGPLSLREQEPFPDSAAKTVQLPGWS